MLHPMRHSRPQIAVLDDEPQMGKALGRLLSSHGLEATTFTLGGELLAACALKQPDCLLLDLNMPVMDGFEVLERLKQAGLRFPVIIITSVDSPEARERAMSVHPAAFFRKPLDGQTLLDAVDLAIRHNLKERAS